jgi:hypothetical protein
MGFLLPSTGTKKRGQIHGESKNDTFVLYTDNGEQRIELSWDRIDDLARMANRLRKYGQTHGKLDRKASDGKVA